MNEINFRIGAYSIKPEDGDLESIKARVIMACKDGVRGKNNDIIFFDTDMEKRLRWNQDVIAQLSKSIIKEDFKVFVQPKVNQLTCEVEGLEALVRWDYPGIGMLTPDSFIPLLEDNGRIREVDRYVFTHVCHWLRMRMDQNLPVFKVSVNLSRNHFEDASFLKAYVDIAKAFDVNPSLIEFEMTERLFMNEVTLRNTKEILEQMHYYGFSCSMDDFGVGYSSLSVLRNFKFDTIKLDRSFFTDIKDKKNYSIVSCIVDLCNALSIEMIAEGIETEEQLEILKQLGIYNIQGYYYGRPMPLSNFDSWLQQCEMIAQNQQKGM